MCIPVVKFGKQVGGSKIDLPQPNSPALPDFLRVDDALPLFRLRLIFGVSLILIGPLCSRTWSIFGGAGREERALGRFQGCLSIG
jgi:hypothetical protein